MRLAASSHSAFARPAQQGTAPAASPMQGFVTLCHMCFAVVAIGATVFAVFGVGPLAFRLGLVVIGVLLGALGEAVLFAGRRGGSAAVSILIVSGIALMLFGWALLLGAF
jgi:hypothetical protein